MNLIDFILHVDKHLAEFVAQYHSQIYGLLFLIVFVETGVVIMPFLPGDSLLFAAGALSANPVNNLNPVLLAVILFAAALCGDNVNYAIGRFFGKQLFANDSKLFKRSYLEKTQAFFAKYGGQAIIRARFVPIVRTFAPFTAGIGQMPYPQFLAYSVAAALLWVGVCLGAGYFFGNFDVVKKHFDLFALGIIFVSILPAIIEVMAHRKQAAAGAGTDISPKESGR